MHSNVVFALNLKSVATRRLYFDMILVYILFSFDLLGCGYVFTFNRAYSMRGHPVYTRVGVYRHFFNNRVVEPTVCQLSQSFLDIVRF